MKLEKERRDCGTCRNYHPILDRCRRGRSVRNLENRRDGCPEWDGSCGKDFAPPEGG